MDNRDLYQESATIKSLVIPTSTSIVDICGYQYTDNSWLVVILAVVYLYQVVLAYRLDSTQTTISRRIIRSLLFIFISTLEYLVEIARVALFYYIISRFLRNNCNARPVIPVPVKVEHLPDIPVITGNPFIDEPTTSVTISPPTTMWFENELELTTLPSQSRPM